MDSGIACSNFAAIASASSIAPSANKKVNSNLKGTTADRIREPDLQSGSGSLLVFIWLAPPSLAQLTTVGRLN